MLNVKKQLTKILNWINGTGRYYSASWTASSTSAFGTKVTADLSLGKGLYVVVATLPYVTSGSPLLGLRTNGIIDNSRLVSGGSYIKASFLIEMASAGTVALYSEGSAAISYSVIDRGSLTAIKLGGVVNCLKNAISILLREGVAVC